MSVEKPVEQLKGTNDQERLQAAFALSKLAHDNPEAVKSAVPALISVIHDPEAELRREAMWALGYVGAPAEAAAPELRRRLQVEESLDCHCAAASALALIGHPEEAMPELLKYVERIDYGIPFLDHVYEVLRKCGAAARDTIPALKKRMSANVQGENILQEPEWDTSLAESVRGIEGARAIPFFIEFLDDEHPEIRWLAALTLADYCFLTADEIGDLVAILQMESAVDRKASIAQLANGLKNRLEGVENPELVTGPLAVGEPLSAEALPLLAACLDLNLSGVRSWAVVRLAWMSHLALPFIPRLIELLADEDAGNSAMSALARMGEPALPALIDAVETDTGEVRRRAIIALEHMGTSANPAVAAVYQVAQQDVDPELKHCCVHALAAIAGPNDVEVFKYLANALDGAYWQIQLAILKLFAQAGPKAEHTLWAVRGLLDSWNEEIRQAAANAITQIEG